MPVLCLRTTCRRRCPHRGRHDKLDQHVWLGDRFGPSPAGSGCDLPCRLGAGAVCLPEGKAAEPQYKIGIVG